jgi:isoleucyl-tRNA synthetase
VLQVVPSEIGPRLGRHTQDVIRAVKAGDWTLDGDDVVAGGHRLEPGEYTLTMVAEGDGASATLDGGTGVIVLDVDVTPDLEQEGRARDLIRLIQQARRDADLAVTDRIAVILRADPQWAQAAVAHRELIVGETLAVELDVDDSGGDTPEVSIERRSAASPSSPS